MNLRGVGGLAWYLQFQIEQDMVADAKVAAQLETAQLRAQARAAAEVKGEDPDRAEAAVRDAPPTMDSGDVPSLEWCERMAKKHAAQARRKIGEMAGLREEILDMVRRDPDDTDKKRGNGP